MSNFFNLYNMNNRFTNKYIFPIFIKKIPFYLSLYKRYQINNYESHFYFCIKRNCDDFAKKIKQKIKNKKEEGINYFHFQLYKLITLLIFLQIYKNENEEKEIINEFGKYIKKYYEIDLNNLINFFKYNIILIPELNSVKNKIKLIMRIQNINDSVLKILKEKKTKK